MSYMDKWIIELEGGAYKQTYKISQEAVPGLDDVKSLITSELIEGTMDRFNAMHKDFGRSFELLKNK